MDGCDLIKRGGGVFFSTGSRRQALGSAVAARRRRDLLNEIMRALAKLDEALMASLMTKVSSALEEQGAPAASNGGGGSVSHGEGILAGKIDEVKAYKHQGAWRRLTAVRVVEEARRRKRGEAQRARRFCVG